MEVLTSLSLLLHQDNPQKEYNSLKLFDSGLGRSLLTVLGEEIHAQVRERKRERREREREREREEREREGREREREK